MRTAIATLGFLTLLGSGLTQASAETQGGQSSFHLISEAARAFDAGDPQKSAKLYEQVLAEGTVNGSLLFNLGNAYYRTSRVGEAIAAYKGARHFLPRDAEVAANLESARKLRKDMIEEKTRPLDVAFFWFSWFTGREFAVASGVVSALAAMWACGRRFQSKLSWWPHLIFLPVSFLLLLSTCGKYFHITDPDEAVVMAEEVSVKSANGEANVTLFLLHAGTEVVLGEQREGWVQIQIADNRKGWVREEFLVKVADAVR
jgi:hypothetical protein